MRLRSRRGRIGGLLLNVLLVTGVLGGGTLGFWLQDRAMKSLSERRAVARELAPPAKRE